VRFVLDTSVIIAGIRSEYGASRYLVEAALRKDFALLLSVPLALEYESVAMREHHVAAGSAHAFDIETLLLALLDVSLQVELQAYIGPPSPDSADTHVLSLAVHGEADAVVTHNVRHFRRPCLELGVGLYKPDEAVVLLRRLNVHDDAG